MHGSTWNWCLFEGSVGTESWEIITLTITEPGFNSHQRFGQWLKCLTNLTNLLGHNLGKTQLPPSPAWP